ncbi:hypothetical protein LZ31DRAFT_189301 [Colletotrichum somersetense]|nr:hypothetical protein LZ31DRAFT_189301 [Colletotrichum somersetense]
MLSGMSRMMPSLSGFASVFSWSTTQTPTVCVAETPTAPALFCRHCSLQRGRKRAAFGSRYPHRWFEESLESRFPSSRERNDRRVQHTSAIEERHCGS